MKDILVFYKVSAKNVEETGLTNDDVDVLYVGIIPNDKLYWYDNKNEEWVRSICDNSDVQDDPEFEVVDEFHNGYIGTKDAIDYFAGKMPEVFINHIDEM